MKRTPLAWVGDDWLYGSRELAWRLPAPPCFRQEPATPPYWPAKGSRPSDVQVQPFSAGRMRHAMGINGDGSRELFGLKVGDSESEPFWSEFIGSLRERRPHWSQAGHQRCPQGPHQRDPADAGGSWWQRYRVQYRFAEGFAYVRNLLQRVPNTRQGMVTAALRSVFAQEKAARGHAQGPRRRAGLPGLPSSEQAQDLEHQSAQARQRRTEKSA